MNENGTNSGINVDEYENMAVDNSNKAKKIAAIVGVGVAEAAVGAGAAYAANRNQQEEPLSADDMTNAANVAGTYQEEVHEAQPQAVVHEKHVKVEEPKEPEVEWEERTEIYENGELAGTVETGTYDGHKVALIDVDGDKMADYVAVDVDGDGDFDANEIQAINPSESPYMNQEVGKVVIINNNGPEVDPTPAPTPYDPEPYPEDIFNDFSDEKTGEKYKDDFAEDNTDYNSDADTSNYQASANEDYLAEDSNYNEEETIVNDDENYYAENDSSTDDPMMGSEEFLG